MKAKPGSYFFLVLLAIATVLTYFIFKPFIGAIVIGIVVGVICKPLHEWVVRLFKYKRPTLSALVSLALVSLIILIPLSFIANSVFVELKEVYANLAEPEAQIALFPQLTEGIQNTANTFGLEATWVEEVDLGKFVRNGLQWLFSNVDSLVTSAAQLFISIFVMLVALFYIFKDGANFGRLVIRLSPLEDKYDSLILGRLTQTIRSVVRGYLIIGVIQGTLTGIGFAIFGVPNPVLWGSVAAISSLIPGIGTSMVLIPGILFTALTGHIGLAIGLLVWGGICVGMVDNILGPKLVEQGVHIHPFFILVSALGGLAYYGPIGFVLGPLTLALLFALLDIYRTIVHLDTNDTKVA